MSEKSMIVDFTQGSAPKQLVVFAVPLLLSNLLQIVYNMVDMVIVGQVLGKVGLSAVSVGGDLTTFLTYLAIGFSNAGQVIIAQYIGAGERKRIGRFVGTMFTFLLSAAIALSVICLVLRRRILGWMNTPAEAYSEAGAYATVCLLGLFFIYGYNAISAVLRGMGDSKRPMCFVAVACAANIALDYLFMGALRMGPAGAALGTTLAQTISVIAALLALLTALLLIRPAAAAAQRGRGVHGVRPAAPGCEAGDHRLVAGDGAQLDRVRRHGPPGPGVHRQARAHNGPQDRHPHGD